MPTITTFLMFEGKAEEAINFYLSVFPDAKVISMTRIGEDGPGTPGLVRHATFSMAGQNFVCIDSTVKHAFTFTPSISLSVGCDSPAEVDELYGKLSDGGQVMMELGEYPFSKRYAWLNDRFGVSWQLRAATT